MPDTIDVKPTHNEPVGDNSLDQLFRDARTFNGFEDTPVPETLLQAAYDLMKWGPTSANCQPARILFLISNKEKERLAPHLSEGNREKTMAAPVTAIIAHDLAFYENLPEQFPHTDARSWFEGNDALIRETAFRNGTLQGAYFILALRAVGLDCGAMSGFDQDGVNRTFFPGEPVKANFLLNIGYGTTENLFPRAPRLDFDRACKVL